MKVLCLDYGERYIGLAISDGEGRLALRYGVIDQKGKNGLDEIERVVVNEKIEQVLVGVPVGLAGQETNQTRVTLAFMETLRDKLGVSILVEGVDETLTSVEAAQTIAAEGGKVNDEHAEAARLMLEQYLR